MSSEIEQSLMAKIRRLPLERQREVLDFVEAQERKSARAEANPPLRGLFAHLGIHISAEDIDEARREAWAGFPKEIN
jgi:hypothetical protein